MIKKTVCYVLLLFAVISVRAQTINTANSKVVFEISNMGVNTVNGTFEGMEGEVTFSATDLANSAFAVCVDASTVDTDNNKRDEHLKNEDFFDVATYPKICFKSTEIVKSSEGYIVSGQLTMHGKSNEVEIPFTVEDQVLTGSFEIKRLDYDVGPSGGFMVGKVVEIKIICEIQ